MGENGEDAMELFSQDGVLLQSAPATYMNYINTAGTLFITEYLNSNKKRCIEWKPNEVTIDSDIQDQEWAVVNTIERRQRTLSGSLPPESTNRSKYFKVNFAEVKSFRVSRQSQKLTIYDGKSEIICAFFFQHGNCDNLVGCLKGLLPATSTKRERHLYFVPDGLDLETQKLDKSFAELNLFTEENPYMVWRFVRNFQDRPYETTLQTFSKITDIVYRSREQREMDEDVKELLNRSLTELENTTTTQSQDEYEVVSSIRKLPPRRDFPRGRPLNFEQWRGLQDHDGRIEDIESIKLIIFRGGVLPSLRKEVWKYLLDYYPWDSTQAERQQLLIQKRNEYFSMKLQWRTMTKIQEENFSDFRERKSLIEKDVNRTDRTIDFYAGDNNANLQLLNDILMTYVMYNFDLGYVQGMSDLLSPILYLLKDEVDSFWCFVGFMNKVSSNFDIDQAGMKEQLENLHTILAFAEPELATYLDRHDSGNMFFCFRWLLVWFKRELSQEDVMRLWEVLWTGYPCINFHLLICAAILETEKQTLTENDYGFTEILKHINDLSGNIDLSSIIIKAEGMYHQIIEAPHLTDSVRLILGLPLQGNNSFGSRDMSPIELSNGSTNEQQLNSLETVTIGSDEICYERAINTSFL